MLGWPDLAPNDALGSIVVPGQNELNLILGWLNLATLQHAGQTEMSSRSGSWDSRACEHETCASIKSTPRELPWNQRLLKRLEFRMTYGRAELS